MSKESLSTNDRICAVMGEVRSRISHDGKFGYEYTTADSMYELLRPLLAKHGLVLQFNILDWKEEQVTPRSGKPFRWALIKAEFSFNDDPPETRVQGVALYGPQGYGAAVTYLQKYWLRGKLLLATGEDDLDGVEPVAPPAANAQAPRTPLAQPKPAQDDLATEIKWISGRNQRPVLCNAKGISYSFAAENLIGDKSISAKREFVDAYNADREIATRLYDARRADEGVLSEDQRARVEALFARSDDRFVVDWDAKEVAEELKGLV